MQLDPSGFELHNYVIRDKKLVSRWGLSSIAGPTGGSVFVGGFTIEIPTSGEICHYLFEQATATGVVSLRVCTEEYLQLFTVGLGPLGKDPVFSYSLFNNQILINSPNMSAPLYGVPGGGLIVAIKQASVNPATTALDIPAGHVCTFGDRRVIANGPNLFFSDAGIDPRTFVAENILAMPGTINDIFQGPDGSLYIFTSKDAYSIATDALGHGQLVQPFIQAYPSVSTQKPLNATNASGAVVCLGKDGMVTLGSAGIVRTDLAPFEGKRFFTPPIEQVDYRATGRIYGTSNGCVIGFGGRTAFALLVDLRNGFRSYLWSQGGPVSVVGTLRGRDGEDLFILRNSVCQLIGTLDTIGSTEVRALACGRADVAASGMVAAHFLSIASDSVGSATLGALSPANAQIVVPIKGVDRVIGNALWSSTTRLSDRDCRSVRHSLGGIHTSDIQLEVGADGAGRRLGSVDLEFHMHANNVRDRN